MACGIVAEPQLAEARCRRAAGEVPQETSEHGGDRDTGCAVRGLEATRTASNGRTAIPGSPARYPAGSAVTTEGDGVRLPGKQCPGAVSGRPGRGRRLQGSASMADAIHSPTLVAFPSERVTGDLGDI